MYKNYIDHDHFGRLWFEITLRNWNVMGHSLEENLEAGPCFEIKLCDYGVVGAGGSVNAAIKNLERCLDVRVDHGRRIHRDYDLPSKMPTMSWWKQWRFNRQTAKFNKDGTCNPVR